jgi:hypothetical protein
MSDVPLKEHLEARVAALERAVDMNIAWLEKTRIGDREILEKRLDSMNEFRDALRDQSGTMFTRVEHEAYQKTVEADLRGLRGFQSTLEGKASQANLNVTFILALAAVVVSVTNLILRVIKG